MNAAEGLQPLSPTAYPGPPVPPPFVGPPTPAQHKMSEIQFGIGMFFINKHPVVRAAHIVDRIASNEPYDPMQDGFGKGTGGARRSTTSSQQQTPCNDPLSFYVRMKGAHVVNKGQHAGSGEIVRSIIQDKALRIDDSRLGRGAYFHPLESIVPEGKPHITFTVKVPISQLVTHRIRGAAYNGHYYQVRGVDSLHITDIKGFNHD